MIARALGNGGVFPPQQDSLLFEDDLDGDLLPMEFACDSADDFITGLRVVKEMFPSPVIRQFKLARLKFEIDRVYTDGEIQGICHDGTNRYPVFAQAQLTDSPAGCACDVSQGDAPCVHCYAFVVTLIDQLERPGTPLRKLVEEQRFTPGTPDHKRFRVDRSEQALQVLDHLVQTSGVTDPADAQQGDDSLPQTQAPSAQRIAWNINRQHEGFEIEPLLQKSKKRGSGFTKGKRMSLERLMHDRNSLPLSPADEQVVAGIHVEQTYYYSRMSYRLSWIDALTHLVGQPNVLLGGEPVQVQRRPLALAILAWHDDDSSDEFGFGFVDQQGQPIQHAMTISNSRAAVTVDTTQHAVFISPLAEGDEELIHQLLELEHLDGEHFPALVERARQLQKRLTMRLPEKNAGPVVDEDAPLAVLLRSRSDGTLDYGVRVRDASGALRRPGHGPLIVSSSRDGKPLQVQRIAERELERAQSLAESLGPSLDPQSWFGSVRDFRQGLEVIEKLQSGGLDAEVLWDKSSEKPVSVLGSLSSRNVRVDITSKRNWFGVTGECDFGSTKVPLKDLLEGLAAGGQTDSSGEYLRIGDGQWARISKKLRQRLQKLRDATHADRSTLKLDATAAPAIRELTEFDIEVNATKAWKTCLDRLERAEKLEPNLPAGLDATLRDYQLAGFKWLRRLAEWGVGGILADDMGLGKTLQTLAVLLDRSDQGPALVIAPTSVGFNWVREAQRFAPDLNVHLYRETERHDFLPSVGPGDLVVCSYGLALRDAAALADVQWNTIVLDEAQAIKNSRSKTSKAIASLQADWWIALTGTPVENHLGELWSLFQVVSPGVFGGWENFRKRYAAPIEKQDDADARASLASRLQPFVLRRTKKEVLTELPPRTEMNLYVDLSAAERAEYEKVRLTALGEIDQIESISDIKDQRFRILAMLTRLRQIACHAGLVNKHWSQSSAKMDQLCETLESLKEEGHRALVFSQFTEHLSLIRKALEARGFTYEYLDGSTPAKARQQAVDRFQAGSGDLFLISLKAGGTGLNLTAADYVIHMDPWWNPAVEDQATDRAHRIGQDKPVMVYRIVARGTVEEEILALHETKRDLVAGVMQGTEAAAKLSNEDLIRMLRQTS